MNKRWQMGLLVVAGLAVVGAAPGQEVLDLLRQGNAAYARGGFAEAAAFYQQAEERTTDPGLVAFNKAAAYYGRGKYAEAEEQYWLCLGDAGPKVARHLQRDPGRDLPPALCRGAGPRLARVLYNVGNCLLQRSEGTAGDLVQEAAVCFDHCTRLHGIGTELRADARHNLELARELVRLHPSPPRDQSDPKHGEEDPQPKETPGEGEGDQGPELDPQRNPGKPGGDDRQDAAGDPQETGQTTPGRGNLAALPDQDKLVPMSAEDAAAHLRQVVQRILGEQRARQEEANRVTSDRVLDW
jgi:tetratricopeptide (TPR) repeat protein